MGIKGFENKKRNVVFKLRDETAFDSIISRQKYTIIVAYHYLCPECEIYLKQFKKLASEYNNESDLAFGKIHIQFEWMIKKAELTGAVEEENVFLREWEVGDAVPATLFFNSGSLVWKPEGVLSPPIFRGLVKKLMEASEE
jgi:hypothetical protein